MAMAELLLPSGAGKGWRDASMAMMRAERVQSASGVGADGTRRGWSAGKAWPPVPKNAVEIQR